MKEELIKFIVATYGVAKETLESRVLKKGEGEEKVLIELPLIFDYIKELDAKKVAKLKTELFEQGAKSAKSKALGAIDSAIDSHFKVTGQTTAEKIEEIANLYKAAKESKDKDVKVETTPEYQALQNAIKTQQEAHAKAIEDLSKKHNKDLQNVKSRVSVASEIRNLFKSLSVIITLEEVQVNTILTLVEAEKVTFENNIVVKDGVVFKNENDMTQNISEYLTHKILSVFPVKKQEAGDGSGGGGKPPTQKKPNEINNMGAEELEAYLLTQPAEKRAEIKELWYKSKLE